MTTHIFYYLKNSFEINLSLELHVMMGAINGIQEANHSAAAGLIPLFCENLCYQKLLFV